MRLIDRSEPTPDENLAVDESLLAACQAAESRHERSACAQPVEVLRFWESARPVVVLGRSGRVDRDVDAAACARADVPVLRRVSGGGAVVLGPGCLNFSLILSLNARPALRDVETSLRIVLSTLARALPVEGLHVEPPADLCWRGDKVSGHAQYRTRDALLHHGTILYDMDLALMSALLTEPVRQPAYRARRSHAAFVRNLPLTMDIIKQAVARAWDATG